MGLFYRRHAQISRYIVELKKNTNVRPSCQLISYGFFWVNARGVNIDGSKTFNWIVPTIRITAWLLTCIMWDFLVVVFRSVRSSRALQFMPHSPILIIFCWPSGLFTTHKRGCKIQGYEGISLRRHGWVCPLVVSPGYW